MKKLIEYFFKNKYVNNDWIVVKTYIAKWISFYTNSEGYQVSKDIPRTTYYDISYSKIKNKFKLDWRGEHNKSTKEIYEVALKKTREMNVQLLSDIPLSEILKSLKVEFKSIESIKDILKEKYNEDFSNSVCKVLYTGDRIKQYLIINNKSLYFIENGKNIRIDKVQKLDIVKDIKRSDGFDLTISGVGFNVLILNDSCKDLETFKSYIEKTLEL